MPFAGRCVRLHGPRGDPGRVFAWGVHQDGGLRTLRSGAEVFRRPAGVCGAPRDERAQANQGTICLTTKARLPPALLLTSAAVMKIPYGTSNFGIIRKEGLFYIDKTPFLPVLERAESGYRNLLFLRPRRFGKSTLLSM